MSFENYEGGQKHGHRTGKRGLISSLCCWGIGFQEFIYMRSQHGGNLEQIEGFRNCMVKKQVCQRNLEQGLERFSPFASHSLQRQTESGVILTRCDRRRQPLLSSNYEEPGRENTKSSKVHPADNEIAIQHPQNTDPAPVHYLFYPFRRQSKHQQYNLYHLSEQYNQNLISTSKYHNNEIIYLSKS
ncbi:hypothetical protein RND71_003160 [Anisodus tanguticus]|uniref:Uncharacterized protein n=1 Tax=Anisodus tanguticus TaxID=243964 RepID=A0AAE1SVY2_9SOLA|nr:hypothetical protein RND71_003160 [Anisodus tanguticus]